MPDRTAEIFLKDIRARFQQYRDYAEAALAQVDDAAFYATLDPPAGSGQAPEDNSVAVLVKHLANNFRSRWTDFLTTDGEKPDRHRDAEFVITDEDTREALMRRWEDGWQRLFDTLDALTPSDVERTVTIRDEPFSVLEALHRGLTHTAYHVGQIVLLAKHHAGPDWQTLSIPRGQSQQFAAAHRRRFA